LPYGRKKVKVGIAVKEQIPHRAT